LGFSGSFLVFLKRGLVGLVSIGFFWACTPLLG